MTYDLNRLIDRRSTDSEKWRRYGDGVLPLWVADMDFRSPEPVIRALRERVEHGIFGYGIEPPALRAVVVERLERLYGWRVAPEAVIFLSSVVAGFNVACRAFAAPGDGVLVQTPVYPPILRAPGLSGLTCDEMALTRAPDGHYTIDWDLFAATITARTRLFILCSPHNPVGRVFERWELERMAELCLRRGLVICSDEIHCDLLFRPARHLPIASLAPEVSRRSVTLLAPSKTYNIAGLHCAVAIIEDPELRQRFQAARRGLVPEPDILSYVAALAAYRDGGPWLEEVLAYLQANRDYLVDYVRARLRGISVCRPEGTFLAWLDCRALPIAGNPSEFFLEQARVALNDGASFGRGGEGFVRLNFGCPRSTLSQALDRMAEALASLG